MLSLASNWDKHNPKSRFISVSDQDTLGFSMTAQTVLTFNELPVEHHFDGPCLASSRGSLKASNDIFLRETKAVGDEGLTVDFLLFQEIEASWVLHQTEFKFCGSSFIGTVSVVSKLVYHGNQSEDSLIIRVDQQMYRLPV